MDSFYDAPRKAPVPTSLDKVLPVPVVPEVSMIAHNTQCNNVNPLSYNKWKTSNRVQSCTNKENCNDSFMLMSSASSIIRKQVRFESPALRESTKPTPLQGANSYNTCNNISNNKPFDGKEHVNEQRFPQSFSQKFDGKTFQQIYMSNIPNRHLDLSILDAGAQQNLTDTNNANMSASRKETTHALENDKTETYPYNVATKPLNDLPQTYKEFLALQKNLHTANNNNDSVTDILNYRREAHLSPHTNNVHMKAQQNERSLAQRPLEKCLIGLEKPNCNSKQNIPNSNPGADNFPFVPHKNQHREVARLQTNQAINTLKCDSNTQTTNLFPNNDALENNSKQKAENNGVDKVEESEPSMKDLVKIIQQQNEQLLLLQKQVSSLIERSEKQQRQIEGPSSDMLYSKKYVTSTQHEICNNPNPNTQTPRKGPLSKFSIDMMTSFEVSFRRQQNEKFRKKVPDFVTNEPQIQEVTETESASSNVLSGIAPVESSCDRKRIDSSLYLQEPLVIREDCPSPEPSIKIDMNDYDSSDDESTGEVPMAVYANVMDQIEKFIKNAQANTFPGKVDDKHKSAGNRKFKNTTMSKVKEATFRHLRSIGVNLASADDSDSSEGSDSNCSYSPSEVSFAVKQLLMKYLPDQYLSKVNNAQGQVKAPFDTGLVLPNEQNNLIPQRPEFSFATLQYMKKYNLLRNNNDNRPKNAKINLPDDESGLPSKAGQILDITTLKQQPKLL